MVVAWYVGLCSAFGIKLSSSIDDVVWLAPFLAGNLDRTLILQNAFIYGTVCMVQTIVATFISYSGKAAVEKLTGNGPGAWSTEKIMAVGAGVLMALFAVKLIHEEYFAEEEDEEEKEKELSSTQTENGEVLYTQLWTHSRPEEITEGSIDAAMPLISKEVEEPSKVDVELKDVAAATTEVDVEEGGKTRDLLNKEMQEGKSTIVTLSDGQVQRQVDVVTLRMFSSSSSKLMLVQVGEESPDGKKRNKMQLPGTKQGPAQELETCVEIIAGKCGTSDIIANYGYTNFVAKRTELESASYPGLFTVYNKKIISGFIDSERSSEAAQELVGLPSCKPFTTIYAKSKIKYFYEWMPEGQADAMLAKKEAAEQDKMRQKLAKAKWERQKTLFVIAFIGSVDDLTLFVPMLAGKGFSIPELMMGALVATVTIVSLCIFVGQCKPIADCLANVPLFAIVIVFSCVLLVKGIFLEK